MMKKTLKLTYLIFGIFALLFLINPFAPAQNTLAYDHEEHPSPIPSPTTTPEPPTEEPIIVWDKDHPLTWDDFNGPVPTPKPEGIDAETVSGVNSMWKLTVKCESLGKSGKVKCTATAEDIKAQAEFDPNTSWSDPDEQTDELLKHEQGHFDISEIFARKKQMRLENAAKKGVMKQGPAENAQELINAALDEMEATLEKICTDIKAEEDKMQERYDKETDHSRNEEKQNAWNKKIKGMLKKE